MLTASEIGLTQRVQTKIKNLQEMSVPFVGGIVQQPGFQGEEMNLEELSKLSIDFNQTPLNPRKVKDIITKTDTGLLQTEFYLFNPIIVGSVPSGDKYIVSGRHRLEALFIIANICNLDFSETTLMVLPMKYDAVELLAIAMAAYNVNRTMTKPEKERVMIAASMDGKLPILENISGNVGTAAKCTKFFKQLIYHTLLDIVPEDNHKSLLTEYTMYKISTYLWKLFSEDEIKVLKSADREMWTRVVYMVQKLANEDYFVKPNYNIQRDTEALENMAINMYGHIQEIEL